MADTKIMEKFVRNLLSRTKDISSLSQKSVRDQYLVHVGREELSTSERDILKQMVKRILLEQHGDSSEDEPLSKVVEKGKEDAGDGRLKEGEGKLQGRAGKRVRDDRGEKAEDKVPKDVKKRKSSQSDSSPNDSSSERSTKILPPGNHNTDRRKTRNPKRGRSKDVETGSEEENEEYDDINGDRDKKDHPQRPHEGDSERDANDESDIVSSKESERDSREQSKTRSKHQQKKKRRVGGKNMEKGRKKCHNIDSESGGEKGGNEKSQELKQPEDVESDSADEKVSQGGSSKKKSEGVEDTFEMQEQCKSESSLESGMDSGAEKKESGKEGSESDGYGGNDGSSRKHQHTQKKGKTNTQTMIQKSGHKKGTKSKGEGNGKVPANDEDHPAIQRLKRYLVACGVRRRYQQLFEGCTSRRAKLNRLQHELEELGVKGKPTLEKCRQVKLKREEDAELAALDQENIIVGIGRRRRQAAWSSRLSPPQASPPSSAPLHALDSDSDLEHRRRAHHDWSSLRGIVSSDGGSD